MRSSMRLLACLILLSVAIGGCAFSRKNLIPPEKVDFGIIETRLAPLKGQIRDDVRIAVGSFMDKTGQYKDANMLRYSSAVTKGGSDVLSHLVYQALGPKVLIEREPQNLAIIQREYELSYKYDSQGRRIGLIQQGGPKGGMTGADYLLTGAVIYYNVDRYSGGGGVNIDGWGFAMRFATAKVSVQLRLIDMSTTETVWSTIQESGVDGWQLGGDVFRFITTGGSQYLVQAEAGIAAQMPADYAFHICLEESIAQMILENEKIFLKPGALKERPAKG